MTIFKQTRADKIFVLDWDRTLFNILICRCMQKHIQHNKDEQTQFFRKIYFSIYSKGFERHYMWEVSWRLNRTATYWPSNTSGYSSISFPFSWAAQPRAWWLSFQHLLSNRSELPVAPAYIIIWRPPTSCERHICTQFNPSTVKVIPWYLRPDAPVIYTCVFLLWQLRWVGGQYVTPIWYYNSGSEWIW